MKTYSIRHVSMINGEKKTHQIGIIDEKLGGKHTQKIETNKKAEFMLSIFDLLVKQGILIEERQGY